MSVKVRPYRNGGWEVDIKLRLPNGKVIRERLKSPLPTRQGTRRWGEERQTHLLVNGKTDKSDKVIPTLEEFGPRFITEYAQANRQKPSSIHSKESILRFHLVPRFGTMRLDQINDQDVQRLKANLAHRKTKTVNNVLTVLNTLLRTAVRWEVIDKMPARIELLKTSSAPPDFYDFAEYKRLVDGADKLDWRKVAMVLLAGDAGLRRGEIIGLEQTDIDHHRKVITVQRSEWSGKVTLPKGGRIRRVPMTERLAKLLAKNRHLQGVRILYTDKSKTVTPRVLRRWMENVQRRAGLAVTGKLHILRHTFCSHLAMRGAPALSIKELAGHMSLNTTMRYMHLSPAEKDRAIRLLDEGRKTDELGDSLETATGG